MIDMYRDRFGVKPICDVLGVPASTYYQIKQRERDSCQRTKRDRILMKEIKRVYRENYEVYGARKIWKQLGREGIPVACCTVERFMKHAGMMGVMRGKRYRITIRDSLVVKPPDLVNRRFLSDIPNALWVGDFTYVRKRSGMCYTAFVIDAFSRSILGFRVNQTMGSNPVLDALQMALWARKQQNVPPISRLVHHSDAGRQYTSCAFMSELQHAALLRR